MEKEIDETYDRFIKSGLAVGFTDDQIDFLWDCFEVLLSSNK